MGTNRLERKGKVETSPEDIARPSADRENERLIVGASFPVFLVWIHSLGAAE
jgi:hypothetical protein